MAEFIITADSIPDYDESGFDDYWSCTNWIDWHKAMKAKYGKQKADQTWLNGWNDQGGFEHNINWCKYAAQFNAYVNAEQLPVTHLLSDVISGATRVGGNLIGAGEQVSKAPLNVAKILKWLIPAVLIVAVIGAIVYFGRRYNVLPKLS